MKNPKNEFKDIQDKSSRGIKWIAVSEIFIRLFQYVTTIILANILEPADFGLLGICLIFTQLAHVLFDFGFSSALIQKKDINEIHYSTTFVLYLVSVVIFVILVLVSSPHIASFFGYPVLDSLLKALSVVFLFYALNAIPVVRLQKEMRFKRYGSLQAVSVLIYGVVTIVSAIMNAGVWSFVYGILAEQFVFTLLLNVFAWWKPKFAFSKMAFKELIHFGSSVLGTRFVAYLNVNAPNFIIGKVLGASALGYYNIAYQLVEFPVQRISKNVLRVMFPAFSKLQDDPENYNQLYKTTVYHLLLILLPIFVGLILIAPYLVELLYGEKWLPAILPLQLLAAAGFFRSVWATTSIVFLSKGVPQIELKINIGFSVFLIPVVLFFAGYGLTFVAAAVSVSTLIFLLIAQYQSLKLIRLSWLNLLQVYFLPASGVTSFTALIIIFHQFNFSMFSSLFKLVIIMVVSIVVYTLLILKFDRKIIHKLKYFIGAQK